MSPAQELYSGLLVQLRNAFPGRVWDDSMVVPEGTPYPFIQLGSTQDLADFRAKAAFFGRVSLMVHVWQNDPKKRGDLSALMFSVRRLAARLDATSSYGWCLSGCDEQVIPDNTTKEPLMHGVLSFEFKYWRKKP